MNVGVHVESCQNSCWDCNRSPGIVSLLVDSIKITCGVHLEFSRVL